jgi:hypothetical protein
VTGLRTNVAKSEIYDINCEVESTQIADSFRGKIGQFPYKYLGLSLHIGRMKREAEQILIDKIGAKLVGWKGRLLTKSVRLALVQSVLSSIPTYHMSVFTLSKWKIKKIDRIKRNFLWKGSDDARTGHCLVNWQRVTRPKNTWRTGNQRPRRFQPGIEAAMDLASLGNAI